MHPKRKQRLFLVLFVVVFASVAIGLMLFALRENINLFYPPSKIVSGEVPLNTTIRAGGCVVPGSVQRSKTNLDVVFVITDGNAEVEVLYNGILPDLFSEGEAAVVSGKVNERRVIEATQVLAKHDESYMPPEVAEAVSDAGPGANEAAEQGKDHQASCEGMSYEN
jgi:cytochrome c-type biogenesis protein CcmE|tara:strand:- start:750 stop:1247 length:498 start_codon:yes stop_codon:yes gene_type:complete